MRRIAKIADRLLNRVVPAAEAAAAPGKCVVETWNWECAGGGFQSCVRNADCTVTCTECQA